MERSIHGNLGSWITGGLVLIAIPTCYKCYQIQESLLQLACLLQAYTSFDKFVASFDMLTANMHKL